MIRILSTLLASAILAVSADAQEQAPFFPLQTGTVLEYEQTGPDGLPSAYITTSVEEITGDFMHGSTTVASTVRYPGDTLSVRSGYPVVFEDGEVITDLAGTVKESVTDMLRQTFMQAGLNEDEMAEVDELLGTISAEGEIHGIPSGLSVGMELPDCNVDIIFMTMRISTAYHDRKVSGREKLATPAGTFDCYIVEETCSVKSALFDTGESQVTTTGQKTWYARGVGEVKQEITDSAGNIISTTVLSAIR